MYSAKDKDIQSDTRSVILQIGTNSAVDGYSDPVEVDTKGNLLCAGCTYYDCI